MPRKGARLSPDAAERQREAIKSWHDKNTEVLKFSVRVRAGCQDAYRELAHRKGVSLTSLIRDYLNALCAEEGIDV